MGSVVLAAVCSIILGGGLWLLAGSKLKLHADSSQNEVLNVIVYVLVSFVILFALFFSFLG